MTYKGQGRDPSMFAAHFLENGHRYELGYSGASIGSGNCGSKWSRA